MNDDLIRTFLIKGFGYVAVYALCPVLNDGLKRIISMRTKYAISTIGAGIVKNV